ncbi:MAG: AAA family ATPase [Nocardiaceae bacterium]|nr:AAA family ATPase [Nocardiaceae bacterium]
MTSGGSLDPIAYETHSGLVVLVGDRAYKAKKAIVTPFLDFGDVERRRQACQRETELNRRLSPDVYLGVGELTDPTGRPSEPVLFMRRMPAERRLSALVRGSEPVGELIADLAARLATFHAGAKRGPDIDDEGRADALQRRWSANLTEMAELGAGVIAPAVLKSVGLRVEDYISARKPLFERRIAEHRIVDGHGDLIADDIFCLPDGPRMLDCLDFDDRLRYVDVADDIAFLQMDLEFLGRGDLADALGDAYDAHTGDPVPHSLRHHYIAYRAVVRAKVELLRWHQGSVVARRAADEHLRLAVDHLERGVIRLALVGGLPGTGKTTLARALADRVGAVVISSDVVRRTLQAEGVVGGTVGEYGQGLYTSAHRDAVYERMIELARVELGMGSCVILDASWMSETDRARAAELAAQMRAALIELRCTAPPEVADERIRTRRNSESDATPAIAAAAAAAAQPWFEAVPVDTSNGIEPAVQTAESMWRLTMSGSSSTR